MNCQPNAGYESNDVVQTPFHLCEQLAIHFYKYHGLGGDILEPCAGEGNFLRALQRQVPNADVQWCEISAGIDFYDYKGHVDWIVTNPPFSQLRQPRGKDTHPVSFMEKCFQVADNVALIMTLNHAIGLKSRYSMADKYGFRIKEILLLDTPPEPWPQSGFQVGCVYWQKMQKPRADYLVTGWHHYRVFDLRKEVIDEVNFGTIG